MKAGEEDWCLWMVASYPKTLKALMKLDEFAGNARMADAYICGYYRGLKKAAFRMNKFKLPPRPPKRKLKSSASR
jgi:hypothetical protein